MTPGTRLGPYKIVAAIGAGGMGTVYRARDLRLGRDVAIKVSAERFSDRFEREARAIAALNHPSICTLHDVGPNYLVMELIDGPTLADRIAKGPVPLDESLRIARQVADALRTAHDRGIIHRDLKPANIKVTSDGVVKVLDFGLAKHGEPGGVDGNPEELPTMPPATQVGTILGTAAYMAPEQALGHVVDKRADIWAFGVVLYEMLTGRRLFQGTTTSDTLAAVLTTEPEWDPIPAAVRPLLQRCLVKDPKRRLRDIGDVDLAIEIGSAAAFETRASAPWLAWIVAGLALVALASLALVHFREQPRAAAASMRFQIPPSVTLAASGNVGLSPDGRQLAFLAVGEDGLVRLWIRAMDSLEVRPLVGSETAANAPPFFWSPDGHFIAFDAGGVLKKLNVSGGPAQTLCDLPATAIGGSWNSRGDIIIGNVLGGLLRVPETGGPAMPVTTVDSARNVRDLLPTFLPDERHFIYLRVGGTPADTGVYLGTLDATPDAHRTRRLMPYVQGITYAASGDRGPGRLLFVREGTLMAQPFDDRRLEFAGDAVPLADHVGAYLDTAFFSTSQNGILVYRTADPAFPITWLDRHGTVVERVSDPGQYASLALSPEGRRAVVSLTNPRNRANADLWLVDLSRGGSRTRFTSAPGVRADFPVWSPDGSRIAFRLDGEGGNGLFQKRVATGQDEQELLSSARGLLTPTSWSPDGRFLLYADTEATTGWDLWVLPLDPSESSSAGKPVPFARTRFNEEAGRFSPDGRWIAYVSNATGINEIYVRAFAMDGGHGSAGAGDNILVSNGGGTAPRWRRDGKELFYVAPDGKMMAVGVSAGPSFAPGKPAPLFQTPPATVFGDVTADGQRFLMVQSGAAPFTVVLNWMR